MIKVEVKGLDAVIDKFKNYNAVIQGDIQAALNDWADRTATNAKQLVSSNSSDEGNLLRSISPVYGNGGASVVATARYAAYIEFGTRKFAANYVSGLPDDWASYAGTFKGGGGGSFADFVKSLMAWCRHKGMDEVLAYPIAKKIMIEGIRPRPFLYPAAMKNLPILVNDIKDIFK